MASLRDSEGANIRVEVQISGWVSSMSVTWGAKRPAAESGVSLNSALSSSIALHVSEDRIGKDNCLVTLEEIIGLYEHIEKILSRRVEDEFEWSTVDESVEYLRVRRELDVLHVDFSLKLYGSPEGYRGNAGLQANFDTSEGNVKLFGREIQADVERLLLSSGGGRGFRYYRTLLEGKIKKIRETGENPYRA